jgi:hypothetical protein
MTKSLIKAGATYVLTYVVVGEWDTINHNKNGDLKLPYVMVGFSCNRLKIFIQRTELHISRSTLEKLIGPSGAKSLIVKSIGGDNKDSLVEALMGQLSINDFPHLSQYRTHQRLLTGPSAPRYVYPGYYILPQQTSSGNILPNPNFPLQ